MKRIAALLLSIFVAVGFLKAQDRREINNLVLENIPEITEEISQIIDRYLNVRAASLGDWSPRGDKLLIRTRFGNTYQFHVVDSPLGARKQLTFFEEPVSGGSFSPDPDYAGFLFLKDFGGNEFSQLFWFDMKSGYIEMLSDGSSRNLGIKWSNKGGQFAFTSTRRNAKNFDIYLTDIEKPKKADLIHRVNSGFWSVTDWSPDDKKLLMTKYISANKSSIYILDLQDSSASPINETEEEIVFSDGLWSADSKGVYLITNKYSRFNSLAYYDLLNKKLEPITEEIPWNVEELELNRDRSKLAFKTNENGISNVYLLDTKTDQYKKLEGLPAGQIYSLKFRPESKALGMVINTTKSPGDIHSYNLNSNTLTQWTNSEVGGLNTEINPVPELITYPTFDKVDGEPRKIPAFIYRPEDADEKYPLVIYIHGGPESQFKPYFSSFFTFLTNELGVAVIAPNVRGSAGYGKDYLKLDNAYKREESVRDIGELIKWINSQREFDSKRIAVYGGSYGGYMVLSSMVHYNDLLRCGVDVVGISNFVTFLENTEDYRRDLRRVEYGDERDPEMRQFLVSISPTTHAEKINKPLFVIQGENDPRVPVTESEQMVEEIRESGGNVWYLLAKDEGHGFSKKENRDFMYKTIALFFQKYLVDVNAE